MRDAREAAGFQYAGAVQHLDEAAIGVADANEAVAALPSTANRPGEQRRRREGYEKPGEPLGDLVQSRGGLRARPRHAGKGPRSPGRIGRRQRRDLAAGLEDAEQRQDRHQHRNRQRRLAKPRVPRPHPQPEMQPDHRVAPGDDEHDQLDQA